MDTDAASDTNTPGPDGRTDQAAHLFGRPEGTTAARTVTQEGEGEGEDVLTPLHPNYKLLMRITAVILALLLVVAALVVESQLTERFGVPFGAISGPVALLALVFAIRVPITRYRARGYQLGNDRLRVVRGVLWHSDTVVPFGRVQHIDVDQGPIERALDLATLTLHTAGSHNASVSLPGLGHERAIEMRETIRAHIRRESM
ncbi:PH domain-containing protein [Erythrobacter sp.]|uniref:PH domain-containing protein n=1 Tax=Erythrobacter sp. TaxID=1042 RepID=UPI003C768148